MEEDIKVLEEMVEKSKDLQEEDFYKLIGIKQIQTIANFIKAYKQKDKDNNDLRRLYRRTAEKLKENGKEELADYFLAQINEIPTFVVDDDIDYYEEYYKLKEENKKLHTEIAEYVYFESTPHKELKKRYIPKSLVEEKIEEYEELVDDFEKTDNTGRFKRTKSIDYYKLEAFKELLKGE